LFVPVRTYEISARRRAALWRFALPLPIVVSPMHRIQEEVLDTIRAVLSELGLIRSEADMDATMELSLRLM
jgi:hypothetical protein